MRTILLVGAALPGLLAGCGGAREAEDAAEICLTAEVGDPGVVELLADEPLVLHATALAGCHTAELDVSCEAVLDGDRITVTSLTTWIRTEPLATRCESIAYYATATCETEPLPEGVYTVAYAGEELVIEVPGTVSGCL